MSSPNMTEILEIVRPGDILVYSGKSIFSVIIRFKTYSRATHVARYIGDGQQREFKEFRDAQQVPLRVENLIAIYRPVGLWHRFRSDRFWNEVKDQGYDYVGLVWSFFARKQGRKNNKMFCSEYVVRDDRIASDGPFLIADHIDADGVAPADIDRSPNKTLVWSNYVENMDNEIREIGFRIWHTISRKLGEKASRQVREEKGGQ